MMFKKSFLKKLKSKIKNLIYLHSEEDIKLVELLLKHGANPNILNNDGDSVLAVAAALGNLEFLCAKHNGKLPKITIQDSHVLEGIAISVTVCYS